MARDIIQVRILHLSDLHFGKGHLFDHPLPADPFPVTNRGPTLLESLRRDLDHPDLAPFRGPARVAGGDRNLLIAAITGDLTNTADQKEFDRALEFIRGLTAQPILGGHLQRDDVFVVPGNHDLTYGEEHLGDRWSKYCRFAKDHNGTEVDSRQPENLTRVVDRSDEGLIVVEINSARDVQKSTPDAKRGLIGEDALFRIQEGLRGIEKRDSCVKIALVHHHPILLPGLAESGRGYDAIVDGQQLLTSLQEFRFHLVLHGHKHHPHLFTYDAVSAWSQERPSPIQVIAGGSAGSEELERKPVARNTYGLILVTLNARGESHVRVMVRGLERWKPNGAERLRQEWEWKTLSDNDLGAPLVPAPRSLTPRRPASEADASAREARARLQGLRFNLPVVESLEDEVVEASEPVAEYEARVWIPSHPARTETPVRVQWSDGSEVVECAREDDPMFAASFRVRGATAICATMTFTDGSAGFGWVHAFPPARLAMR